MHIRTPARWLALSLAALPLALNASSHREAPQITETPKVDGTDFYMFRSYAPGREGYVTMIANFIPFQDPQGGPNFYQFDQNALYEIHVDNNGDAKEDISFQFQDNLRILCCQSVQERVDPADPGRWHLRPQ
jgi:hypothetical protein